jgi:hypothetical protein
MTRRSSVRVVFAVAVASLALTSLGHAAGEVENTKAYREAAWAHFQKQCKENAKETILQVIHDVEGIFLAKPRTRPTEKELRDQFWMGDPYGYSNYEALYPIATYLFSRSGRTISDLRFSPIAGFKFVEVEVSEASRSKYQSRFKRYELASISVRNLATGQLEKRTEPLSKPVDELRSKYGVTWEDISSAEDRRFWVAGGRLQVYEIHTRRVIGERIGYVIESRFGDLSKGRRPWLAIGRSKAAFCPSFENYSHKNKEFVAKVLKASSEDKRGK